MDELKEEIRALATAYMEETDDGDDVPMESFPMSIVNFVFEYAYKQCHFPSSFSLDRKKDELSECKNAIAMACVEIYLKIGNEGQTSYSSNGISRHYRSEWINPNLLEKLPNYVRSIQ